MRWFFLLLLVLNLFYYVWHQQQAPLKVQEVEPMALYKEARQGIRLLDAEDRAKVRKESSRPSSQAGADATCLFLGSFQSEDAARQIEQRLIARLWCVLWMRRQGWITGFILLRSPLAKPRCAN
jgi:hypothetical protein